MLRKFALFVFASLLIGTASAQEYHSSCGTVGEWAEQVSERLLRNKDILKSNPLQFRNEITYVPIKFHLVAKTDGTGRITENKVLEQLCALNQDYAPMNIQFYIKNGFKYINNTAVYDNHPTTTATIMSFNRDPGAINIWIVNDASPGGGGGPGTVLGYYNPSLVLDWIVVRRDQIGASTSTLSHEVGHFFSLNHPHNGWDAEPWDLSVHGNPAPVTSPGGVPTERADGSNCETAGDYLCDTPADYNGFGWANCNYTGGAQDPTGALINPEERLFMGYFLSCLRSEYFFSTEQQDLVITDLMTPQRNYVRPNFTPNLTIINENPELIYPTGGSTTIIPGYNAVNFQWSAVNGAEAYILEIDRVPTMTISPTRMVVYGTNKVVTSLEADKVYHWRVRPFSSYSTCQPSTQTTSFRTGTTTSANEIEFVSDWQINPNPVSRYGELNISVDSQRSFEAQINLFSVTGQLVRQEGKHRFEPGPNTFILPLNGLSEGVYLLSIQTTEGRLNQRVIVQ
jgi:hypothetical protein